jgi:putative SOS response-associated peptidase YedK
MCGRYDLHNHPGAVALAMGLPFPHDIIPRYNIAPTQEIPVVRSAASGEREMVGMRWGFVPRWAKDPSIGLKMINARGETVATSKAFGTAFQRHRCLIPADGFYEWQKLVDGRKQPMRIALKDGSTFAFAGLAERWLSPEGEVVDSCTIITIGANAFLRPIHARMPVIIPPPAYERWLDTGGAAPQDLLAAYPGEAMHAYPVSTRVNVARNDDATLIEPVPASTVAVAEVPADTSPREEVHAAAPKQDSLF